MKRTLIAFVMQMVMLCSIADAQQIQLYWKITEISDDQGYYSWPVLNNNDHVAMFAQSLDGLTFDIAFWNGSYIAPVINPIEYGFQYFLGISDNDDIVWCGNGGKQGNAPNIYSRWGGQLTYYHLEYVYKDDQLIDIYTTGNVAEPSMSNNGQLVWFGNKVKCDIEKKEEVTYGHGIYANGGLLIPWPQTKDIQYPRINDKGHIVWTSYDPFGNPSIYYWNGSVIKKIFEGTEPQINNNDHMVWLGLDGNDYEIFYWDGSFNEDGTRKITQVTNNEYFDYEPQINNNDHIVWKQEVENYHSRICYWDGTFDDYGVPKIQYITTVSEYPYNESPQINDKDHVVWGSYDGSGIGKILFAKPDLIETVEVTQGIQVLQYMDDLDGGLVTYDNTLPVPIIAGKRAAIRIYPREVKENRRIRVEASINGEKIGSISQTLLPGCDTHTYRFERQSDPTSPLCLPYTFFFTPSGKFTLTIDTFDEDDNSEAGSYTFTIDAWNAAPLDIQFVKVCDGNSCGNTLNMQELKPLLEKLYPTAEINAPLYTDVTVTESISACDYDSSGDLNSKEETICWYKRVLDQIENLKGKDKRIWYGIFSDDLSVVTTVGWSREKVGVALSKEPVKGENKLFWLETVAHEIGHLLGANHTNRAVPCGQLAEDAASDYPYEDNYIQSFNSLQRDNPADYSYEIGYDVKEQKPIDPLDNYDLMSYCYPNWITPFTYCKLLDKLTAQLFDNILVPYPSPVPPPPVSALLFQSLLNIGQSPEFSPDQFWKISGTISWDSVSFNPIFTYSGAETPDPGEGTYQMQILDDAGQVLFIRMFTPYTPDIDPMPVGETLPLLFSEAIPVVSNANEISIINATNQEIGFLSLAGTPPTVTVTYPAGGETLSGTQTITWSVIDPDSDHHRAVVEYSPDNGINWRATRVVDDTESIEINFDELPGSINASLLRVLVTDGVHTGIAQSEAFTVPKKGPALIEIVSPKPDTLIPLHRLIWLEGDAYDPDEGSLEGNQVSWESDIDGPLGQGRKLSVSTLSAGTHQITFTATDSDGNSASAFATLTIVNPPIVDLSLVLRPNLACSDSAQVTINASPSPGGPELSTVSYSLDGGVHWTQLLLTQLPYTFTVTQDGSYRIIAQATDAAGQMTLETEQFCIDNTININAAPLFHDFGKVSVGASRTVTVTISLASYPVAQVNGINFSSDSSSEFSFASPLPAFPVTLSYPDRMSIEVPITFAPANGGYSPAAAALEVSSNDAAEPLIQLTLAGAGTTDYDNDGVIDVGDNCPCQANPDQTDTDEDGRGDACDYIPFYSDPPVSFDIANIAELCSDPDGDGVSKIYDNCPSVVNPDQLDYDEDGFGDACDKCPTIDSGGIPDADGDGVTDSCDKCPNAYDPNQEDADNDGIGDACDNCLNAYNPDQIDSNGNGVGDACEPTLIVLTSFTATSTNRSVLLQWTTVSEIDNVGFNIYRTESADGGYVKINSSLIPAKGSPTQSAAYQFVDENVQNRKTYFYKLEDIDLNGKSTMHGPVSAEPRRMRSAE